MLRKLLIILVCSFIAFESVYSQCVPNTSITTSGIFPDSATGLSVGTVGQLYNQVIQIRVPVDSTVTVAPFPFPVTVTIVSIDLTSFTGLPPGLTYTCTPSSCSFPGGSNGCVQISGTPTTSGVFTLHANLTTHYTLASVAGSRVDSVNYYQITINNSNVGLNQHTAVTKFNVEQNTPNPFSDITTINYATPVRGAVEFKMYNIIGKEVFHDVKIAEVGQNSLSFDGHEFAPGIYMYSMTFNNETISKRLVISRK